MADDILGEVIPVRLLPFAIEVTDASAAKVLRVSLVTSTAVTMTFDRCAAIADDANGPGTGCYEFDEGFDKACAQIAATIRDNCAAYVEEMGLSK